MAEIGLIARFPSDDAVAKYAGLTWRTHQLGTFDAVGQSYLRYYLVEAADRVRVRNPEFEAFYLRKYARADRMNADRRDLRAADPRSTL